MDELGELPSDAAMKKKETVLHDSMVTVRLSEPEPELGRSATAAAAAAASGTAASSAEIGKGVEVGESGDSGDEDEDEVEVATTTTATEQSVGEAIPEEEDSDDTDADTVYETEIARMEVPGTSKEVRRGSERSDSETESVNWEVLERTEEQEPRDQDTEDVSFPFPRESYPSLPS